MYFVALQLHLLPSGKRQFSLLTLKLSGEKLAMCLSLGNTAASIHVMNSTYFSKENETITIRRRFHVTNCSSEFLASLSSLSLHLSL